MPLFIYTVKCRDCGELLAQSKPVPENGKLGIVMSAPIMTPSCPKGCEPTYGDCNSNTDTSWSEVPDEAKVA